MNWNTLFRRVHRWLSIAFVVAILITSMALAQQEPIVWMSYVPLLPLALLFVSGLYLFALPYAQRWRGGRHSSIQE